MLRLQDLRKRFGSITAVDGVSLEIRQGEIFGLLGPNGAGKSTTIGLAVGLLVPDSGTVELDGVSPSTTPEVRRLLGVAPQSLSLYEDLTGAENLALFGRIYGLRDRQLRDRVEAMLHIAGLHDRRAHRVKTYSGGMKRRLNLAVALIHDPPLLLLDEPTVGVDPQSRNAIFENIRELRRTGRTILYTTHYMEEAQRLCDRVGIIDRGHLLDIGEVDELIERHGGKSTVTVRRNGEESQTSTDDPMGELAKILRDGGVEGVRVDRPDLETVFLSLTGRSLRD